MSSVSLSLSMRSNLMVSSAKYSPSTLFSSGEVGVWFDPTNITTLYQDINALTQVTAPGQTCALMLDKSKGLVLGSNILSTAWTMGFAGASTATNSPPGTISLFCDGTNAAYAEQSVATEIGVSYRVTLTTGTGNILTIAVGTTQGGGTLANLGAPANTAKYTFIFTATTTTTWIKFLRSAGGTCNITNISAQKIPGYHAVQPTAAQRPTYGIIPYGGVRNLLTYSEQFDNAVWRTVNATAASQGNGIVLVTENSATGGHYLGQNSATGGVVTVVAGQQYTMTVEAKLNYGAKNARFSSENAGIIDLVSVFNLVNGTVVSGSGASIVPLGDGWYRLSVVRTAISSGSMAINHFQLASGTSASYAGDGSSSILYRNPQFELGSTTTAYQKVVSKYEVTEAGKASLGVLYPDGIDDWMITPSINFSGTNKMTVWAGLQKMSDVAAGMLAELSSNAALVGNIGSFYLSAPNLPLPSDRYGFFSRGSALAVLGQTSLVSNGSAPDVAILTALGDISSDVSSLSRNGVAGTNGTVDQGAGNYGNYPLYLFRRGGASLPYNGIFTGLIVRGAASSASQISNTNAFMNSKLGAY